MPGYLLHLTEGQIIINHSFPEYDSEWKKYFQLGTILPDFCSREEKLTSHFWKKDALHHFYRIPDIEAFREVYSGQIELRNPVILGVYAHLMLDHAFYTDYWKTILEPIDGNGKYHDVWDDELYVRIKRTNQCYKREEFFSDAVLYGDYTKLNSYFLKKYKPNIPTRNNYSYHLDDSTIYKEMPAFHLNENLEKVYHYIFEEVSANDKELLVFETDSLEERLLREAKRFSENL